MAKNFQSAQEDHHVRFEAALKDLQRNQEDADLQAEACKILFELAQEAKLPQSTIAKALRMICRAMGHFPEHVELNMRSFGFMTVVTGSGTNAALVDIAVKEGFIAALLNAMQTNRSAPKIQITGCFVVNFLATSKIPACLDELWRGQALFILLKALSTCLEYPTALATYGDYRVDTAVMHSAYGTIISMLENVESDHPSRKPVLTGLPVILRCMAMHTQSPNLLSLAMRAISASAERNSQNAEILGTKGIKSVIDMMRAHESDVNVQMIGCRALAFMIFRSQDRKKFADQHKCIHYVVRIMRVHAANPGLQKEACFFCSKMMDMLGEDDDYRLTLGKEGFVDAAAKALHAHKECEDLSFMACEALQRFAQVRMYDSRHIMMTQGACDEIMAAMKAHKHNIDILVSGCYALTKFLQARLRPFTPEFRQLRERITPVILEIMSINKSSAWLASNCALALAECCSADDTEAFERQIQTRDGIQLLTQCMGMHVDDTETVSNICEALSIAIFPGILQERCRECGAIELLLQAALKHKQDSRTLSGIRKVLKLIVHMHAANHAYLTNAMSAKHAKILQRSDQHMNATFKMLSEFQFENCGFHAENSLQEAFRNSAHHMAESLRTDLVAAKLVDRAKQKLAETCSQCGQSAQALGKQRLLKCSGCNLGRLYCCSECQKAHWAVHKVECRANRMVGK
jgi:hypothetical protein